MRAVRRAPLRRVLSLSLFSVSSLRLVSSRLPLPLFLSLCLPFYLSLCHSPFLLFSNRMSFLMLLSFESTNKAIEKLETLLYDCGSAESNQNLSKPAKDVLR